MNILIFTIPITIAIVIFFVFAYLSAVKHEQFDDLETPAHIPFTDDIETKNEQAKVTGEVNSV